MNRDPANTLHVNHVNAEKQRFDCNARKAISFGSRYDVDIVARGLTLEQRTHDGRRPAKKGAE